MISQFCIYVPHKVTSLLCNAKFISAKENVNQKWEGTRESVGGSYTKEWKGG